MNDKHSFSPASSDNPREQQKNLMANPEMSRRSFFSLAAAVGALTFLGSVLTPRGSMLTAWADEDDKVHFTLYILGRDEMPILCYDLSDSADSKTPVEGMSITITSPYNTEAAALTATTNAEGFATVRIKAMSQQATDDKATVFSFYGEVVAEKDGYRKFHIPETYLCAGVPASTEGAHVNTLEIPTHKVGTDDIYVRTAALDGSDVQYSAAECPVGSVDTTEHTFDVEIIAPANKTVEVKVFLKALDGTETTWGSKPVTATTSDPQSYVASFTGAWLKDAAAGSMLKVKFGLQGQTALVMSSPVTFVTATAGLSDVTADATIRPGQNSNETPATCPIPAWIIAANDTFTCALPAIPVKVFSDFKGNFGVSATLFQYTFLKRRDGNNKLEPEDKFKHMFGGLGAKKAWKGYKDEVAKSIERLGQCYGNEVANKTVFGTTKWTNKIDGSFQAQVMGYFSWKKDTSSASGHYWAGDLAIALTLGVDASWTKQFIGGFIPFYIVADLSANVTAKLTFGMKFDDGFKNIRYGHTLSKAPMAVIVVIHMEAGFSLAAGVACIAGLGLRGGGFIRFELIFDQVAGKAFPHMTVTMMLKLDAFVQVFFLKKTWNICSTPLNNLYDNWKTKSTSSLANATSQMNLMSAANAETMAGATVVTNEELGFVADYAGTLVPVANETSTAADESSLQSLSVGDDEPDYVWEFTPIKKKSGMSLMEATDTTTLGLVSPYDTSGKTTYNPLRGLKPTLVNKRFERSYSNAHLKVVQGYSGGAAQSNGSGKNYGKEPIAMARLVTADVSGVNVTRVAVALWNYDTDSFGDEQIVELYDVGVAAEDRYDVDFDFDVAWTYDIGRVVYLAITSVVRPASEDFTAYEKQQFVSVIAWHYDQALSNPYYNKTYGTRYTFHDLLTQNAAYATSHPRLVLQRCLGNGSNVDSPLVPYLYYYKTEVVSGMTTLNMTVTNFNNTTRIIDDLELIRELPDDLASEDFRRGEFSVYAPMRYKTASTDSTDYQTSAVIGWTGRNKSKTLPEDMFVNDGSTDTDTDANQGAPYSFLRSIGVKVGETKSTATTIHYLNLINVASLTKRTDEETDTPFVYMNDASQADESAYKTVILSDKLYMSVEETEGKTGITSYFASHNGKRLYTVHQVKQDIPGLTDDQKTAVKKGTAKVYSEVYTDDDSYDDTGDVTLDGGQMASYQLLEARWHDKMSANNKGSYYDFYPIAQLDFCPDDIDVITYADGRRDFIMTTISAVDKTTGAVYSLDDAYDMDNVYHQADVYHVAVPPALGLHVMDLQTTSPFAAAGETTDLLIKLANIGNWFVTGFSVEFYGPDDKLIDTYTFEDLENRVQDTEDNYSQALDDEGNPKYDDDGQPVSQKELDRYDQLGMLAPGSTRTYYIEFKVPSEYEGKGETKFSLRIVNPICKSNDLRANLLESSDYISKSVSDDLVVFVDPNMHGVSEDNPSSAKHTWEFESKSAPYAEDGKDPQPEPEETYDLGDVNANEKINIVDAQLALDIANGNETLAARSDYAAMRKRADVNEDSAVDASDARAIQSALHNSW